MKLNPIEASGDIKQGELFLEFQKSILPAGCFVSVFIFIEN
jgi:hypothetical protein